MTKLQRRKIYEKVLWCIGDENIYGVCILLSMFIDDGFNPLTAFPEFAEQQPADQPAYCSWWLYSRKGNKQRRIALEKAIQLTY